MCTAGGGWRREQAPPRVRPHLIRQAADAAGPDSASGYASPSVDHLCHHAGLGSPRSSTRKLTRHAVGTLHDSVPGLQMRLLSADKALSVAR